MLLLYLVLVLLLQNTRATLAPPSLALKSRTGDHALTFSITPPEGVTGITGYILLRAPLSGFEKAVITSGVSSPPRSDSYGPSNCFDNNYASIKECCTGSTGPTVYYEFNVETPSYFNYVKIFKSDSVAKYNDLVDFTTYFCFIVFLFTCCISCKC